MMQSMPMKPEAPLLETRSSLIQRLKATINGESWEEFFHTYWELIYNVARRAGLSEADAQDIVQETILKVHNSLDRFEYNRKRGTFKGWLRTVTRSRLNDFFKKQQRRPALNQPLEEAADELQNLEDPEGPEIEKIWDEEWNRNLIQAALSRTKKLEPQAISNLQMPLHRRMDRTRNLPNSGRQCRPSLHGQTTRRENIPGSRGNTSGAGVKNGTP